MKMSQIVVVMLLLCMSTGCACLDGFVGSSGSGVRAIPTWVGQPVGEVREVDKTIRVLEGDALVNKTIRVAQVHTVAPDFQSSNIQRSLCAANARMAIAEHMGWVRINTVTEGDVTRTTKQVELGVMHGRRVDVEYWTEDFMKPAYHCVGYVKMSTSK